MYVSYSYIISEIQYDEVLPISMKEYMYTEFYDKFRRHAEAISLDSNKVQTHYIFSDLTKIGHSSFLIILLTSSIYCEPKFPFPIRSLPRSIT